MPVIAVPARNEAERLPALLAALAEQSWIAEHRRRLPVVVVLNNCTDASKITVETERHKYPDLDIELIEVVFDAKDAHVGMARRMAMQRASMLCESPDCSAILTTDADAVPPPEWVTANLHHLSQGIDLVGGLIVGNREEEELLGRDFIQRARLHHRYGRTVDQLACLIDPLPHDPWPRHHDHTGASIAVRADVYRAVGGMPALPFREDIAFVEQVRSAGFLIRHPMDVWVEVSARLKGRAPGGMADCLTRWVRQATLRETLLVEHPHHVLKRLMEQKRLRGDQVRKESDGVAAASGNDGDSSKTMAVGEAIEMIAGMILEAEGELHAA